MTGNTCRLALLLALVFLWAANAVCFAAPPSLDEEDEGYLETVSPVVPDPLEDWNRAVYGFNEVLIEYVARPISVGYTYVTPQFLRTGIRNICHNLLFPVRFANNLLQGKGLAAGVEMSRFVLNTTAGLGGFFDVAKNHKPIVPVDNEDMGQTFGVWGVGEGFYIMWPFLGPSTLRDSAGMVGDYFLDPLSYSKVSPTWYTGIAVSATRVIANLDEVIDNYDALKRSSVEPYSSFRDAYVQHRRAKTAK